MTENLAGGAGGTIGATVVAKAIPDGYTLLGGLAGGVRGSSGFVSKSWI